jgi:hypothetical protein
LETTTLHTSLCFSIKIEQACPRERVTYVTVWDNVRFHHAELVQARFPDSGKVSRFVTLYLPAYSPFLKATEYIFSAWRWKVYGHHPHEHATLLLAKDESYDNINADQCQAWIRHAKMFFPRCVNNEDIHCDVDENLWPNAQETLHAN